MSFFTASPFQTSLQYAVTCHGVALHSGADVTMTLHPAPADHGIRFKRTDIEGTENIVIPRHDAVCDTKLGTTIANADGVKVMTIEHLMAAFYGCGIDNALVELNGPEIPIMDGSSEPFVFLLECAGVEVLETPRHYLEIKRTIAVEEGGSMAVIKPHDSLALDITIQFDHEQIQTQRASYDFAKTSFKQSLARARTFGFRKDVEALRQIGLARGGSLHNAIVLDDHQILNQEGLRFSDEFVRHKALDCLGDFMLAGGHILGAVTTIRPGHGINNRLLHAIFAHADNYEWQREATPAPLARPGAIAANAQPQALMAV